MALRPVLGYAAVRPVDGVQRRAAVKRVLADGTVDRQADLCQPGTAAEGIGADSLTTAGIHDGDERVALKGALFDGPCTGRQRKGFSFVQLQL